AVECGVHMVGSLPLTVEAGEARHRAQLALLLGDDLAAVELSREKHGELAGQLLVDLLPVLEAYPVLEGVKEHSRRLLRLLPERLVHAASCTDSGMRAGGNSF